ncbi:RNA polymerase sigma factor [Bacillus niameyensis]|uniref:RNA polymerase sigma factor n=1 Tax=Bacillus niameyensis TaxID=1522308 RepID=UPI00078101DE|nr:sigma-70 family RNA polymerase sigma factor [Bacillus niameyensis]
MENDLIDGKSLLEGIAASSVEAFEMFYDHYHAFVYSIAINILKDKQEAEDITHDIFLEISKKAATYNPERGSVESWLAIRTRSRCVDLLRKKKEIPTDEDHEQSYSTSQNLIEETVMLHLDRQLIVKALKKLPDSQRTAVYGNFYENFTHREIAERLKLPLGTVKSLVRYGLKNLRKQLVRSKSLNFLKGDEKNDV